MASNTSTESLLSDISSLSSNFDADLVSDDIASFYQKMTITTTRRLPAKNVPEGQAPFVFETVNKMTETIIHHSFDPPNKMLRKSRAGHISKQKISNEVPSTPNAAAATPSLHSVSTTREQAVLTDPIPRPIRCYVDDTAIKSWPSARGTPAAPQTTPIPEESASTRVSKAPATAAFTPISEEGAANQVSKGPTSVTFNTQPTTAAQPTATPPAYASSSRIQPLASSSSELARSHAPTSSSASPSFSRIQSLASPSEPACSQASQHRLQQIQAVLDGYMP